VHIHFGLWHIPTTIHVQFHRCGWGMEQMITPQIWRILHG
jgi:hypothetical protein